MSTPSSIYDMSADHLDSTWSWTLMRASAIGLAAIDIWRREICYLKTGNSSWMGMMQSTLGLSVSRFLVLRQATLIFRRSNTSSGSHLPMGQSDPIPSRIRSIHLPKALPSVTRYRMPISEQEAWRYRFLGRPREYRRRILVHRRENVSRYRPRVCGPGYNHD